MNYILSLDQGTTSSRAILYNESSQPTHVAQQEFKQIYPREGWVEHNPIEILDSQLAVAIEVLNQLSAGDEVQAIGITNQRETTLIWDKNSGNPIYNAIVWQDRRTASTCAKLKKEGHEQVLTDKTGLLLDPYFSATKIKWILEMVPNAMQKAKDGDLLFGTVDSWLIWNLTNKKVHATDVTNASRTLLYNIHELKWDKELLDIFELPEALLPEVRNTTDDFGIARIGDREIPITAVAGDQQAALFGQLCTEKNMLKCTYGTGCFMVLNTGNKPVKSNHQLLTTIGWKIGDQVTYALEGSVFVGGAIIQWLRDEIGFISSASESESEAKKVEDSGGVVLIPALTGLGAPYWDPNAKGCLFGLTRGTNPAHITRAALESIAFQVNDILSIMEKDSGKQISELRVDGGATANNLLMQMQSDFSDIAVVRPKDQETTALGVAFLAGISAGLWTIDELKKYWKEDRIFKSTLVESKRTKALSLWHEAIGRTLNWPND